MKALKIIIFVIVIGTVSGVLLVGVDVYTKPMIMKNDELKLKRSVLDVFEVSYSDSDVIDVFNKNIEEIKKDERIFYKTSDGAMAFAFRGPGLWGPIAGIISFEKDLDSIRRVKITYQEETPGLGGRIAEAEYLNQFKAKKARGQLIFKKEGESKSNNEVDIITGATGSSRALEKLLNESIQKNLAKLK